MMVNSVQFQVFVSEHRTPASDAGDTYCEMFRTISQLTAGVILDCG